MNISKKKSKFNYFKKYPCVTITDNLSWSAHMHNVKRDSYTKIGIINRVFGKR